MVGSVPGLTITNNITVPEEEIEWQAIRASGPGGQNVNKVSSAIHLRFDVAASSLPDTYKERLLQLKDRRLSKDGIIVIKAQRHRTQDKNREEALERLQTLVRSVMVTEKKRVATKPSRAAKKRRTDSKTRRGKTKALRQRVNPD